MFSKKQVNQLKEKVNTILSNFNIPPSDILYYGKDSGDGSLEVNVTKDSNGWHWLVIERGGIQRDIVFKDIDDILYWIIKDAVESQAGQNINWTSRSKYKDPRKTWLNRSIKLMKTINPEWAQKLKSEYEKF